MGHLKNKTVNRTPSFSLPFFPSSEHLGRESDSYAVVDTIYNVFQESNRNPTKG